MRPPALLSAMLLAAPAAAQAVDIVVEEAVPLDGPDFFLVPFAVPAGLAELEVRHSVVDGDEDDVLDFGVDDPAGFRGWGGGNAEPAIIGVEAASRSYRPGPLPEGTWHVVVGKARLSSSAPRFRIEVILRTTPTLGPATDRVPWRDVPLKNEARWYAGDFHVHSEDSGDARPPLTEIATFSRSRGLDFVVITDHNTDSQVDRLGAAQQDHPDLLLLPGVEFTTYGGHATGFGVIRSVDHRVGLSTTIGDAIAAVRGQGGLFSINHPVLDLGDVCIGCAWTHEIPDDVDAVEIATGGYRQSGFIFGEGARDFWDTILDNGGHAAPLGGSDDHRAGVDLEAFGSPIGDPTTMVFADALSLAALTQGIRDNRVVVKLQGPDDPMVELDTAPARTGDTVLSESDVNITAVITGGSGHRARFLREGFQDGDVIDIDADPFTLTRIATPPGTGEERWRVEVLVDDIPRTVTGHVWLRRPPPPEDGCACSEASAAPLVAALAVLFRRRRRAR